MIKKIDTKEFHGLGWHSKNTGSYEIVTKNKSFSFNLSHTPSGCGSVIMSDYFTNFMDENVKDLEEVIPEFNEFTQEMKDNGVGSIITTVGENFYGLRNKEFFDALDFKLVSTYNNYRHSSSGEYKQHLLIKYL